MYEKDNDAPEGYLYIRDPSTNYEVGTTTRVLNFESEKLTVSASWYVDDSTTALGTSDPFTEASGGMVETNFGIWDLPSGNWNSGIPHEVNRGSKYIISSEKLNNIPYGSDGRIELNLGIPNGVTNKSTLHIRHYTTALWNSNTNPDLTVERSNTTEINNRKEATIKTYHETLTDLSFVSKLYDGSSMSVDANLTLMEVESSWSGDEWTAQVVNNEGMP